MKHIISIFVLLILFNGWTQTCPDTLKRNLELIVNREGFRSHDDTITLNAVAQFIYDEFSKTGATTEFERYEVNGIGYKNVIARIGSKDKPTIVLGAHYDVCGHFSGADDNGSGIVGLIEAIKQLKNYTGEYCLEFVAYTLEEPPYFGTKAMGSYIHASNLNYERRTVYGMVSIEMIGYFSDEDNSQEYPIGIMSWFYGKKGDYILITKKSFNGKFVRKFTKTYQGSKIIRTKKIAAPKSITGIDFSDHRNYWLFNYDALMLTDTSFYRNRAYHSENDTIAILDFIRMAKVVDALVHTINSL